MWFVCFGAVLSDLACMLRHDAVYLTAAVRCGALSPRAAIRRLPFPACCQWQVPCVLSWLQGPCFLSVSGDLVVLCICVLSGVARRLLCCYVMLPGHRGAPKCPDIVGIRGYSWLLLKHQVAPC